MVQRKAIPERHELTEVGLVLHAERLPVSRHCRDLIRNSKSEYRLTALRVSKPHDTSLKAARRGGNERKCKARSVACCSGPNLGHCQSNSVGNSKQYGELQSYPVIVHVHQILWGNQRQTDSDFFEDWLLRFLSGRNCVGAGRKIKRTQKIRINWSWCLLQFDTICFLCLSAKHRKPPSKQETQRVTKIWYLRRNILTGYLSPSYLVLEWYS